MVKSSNAKSNNVKSNNVKSNNAKVKKTKVEKSRNPWKAFVVGLFLTAFAFFELNLNGESMIYWLSFILGTLILIPNSIWIFKGWGKVFGIPYIFTMLRTKYFIKTINNLAKHSNTFEKISMVGLFVGFGLSSIDYLIARKKGGLKRIIILFISAILLYLFFEIFLKILFGVPALEPLYIWGLVGFILLGLGGLSLAFMLGYGFLSIEALFLGEQICPSVAPVLPGVNIPGLGVVVPLIAWVSLGLIMIIHEFAHGVLLSKYKEKLKSVGLILIGIIPMGAFVEQNDKTFMKKEEKKQLLVLSAGATSNLISIPIGLGILIVFYLLIASFAPNINFGLENSYSGIEVFSVPESFNVCGVDYNSPAFEKLQEGDKILMSGDKDVNTLIESNIKITNSLLLYNRIFDSNIINTNREKLELMVDRNGEVIDVNILPTTIEFFGQESFGPIGLKLVQEKEISPLTQLSLQFIFSIDKIIFFFILLSFAVGMFNFLPSNPLDGGRIAQIVLVPYFGFMKFDSKEETQKFIGRFFVWLFLISIIINLLPYFTMFF